MSWRELELLSIAYFVLSIGRDVLIEVVADIKLTDSGFVVLLWATVVESLLLLALLFSLSCLLSFPGYWSKSSFIVRETPFTSDDFDGSVEGLDPDI